MNLEFKFFYEEARIRAAKQQLSGAEPEAGPRRLSTCFENIFEIIEEELGPYVSEFSPRRMAQRATECCRPRPEAIGFHGLA